MNIIHRISYKYFLRLSNTSFKVLAQGQSYPDADKFTQNEQLEAIAQQIYGMRLREQKYLDWKFKEHSIKEGKSLFEQTINLSEVSEDIDPRSYFIQQKFINEQWGEPNTLVNLIYKAADDGAGAGEQIGEVKKKDVYDVELTTVNAADKIKIIKIIRETLNLGLKEAKQLVEKTPVVLKQAKKQQADQLAAKLTAQGCNITVK